MPFLPPETHPGAVSSFSRSVYQLQTRGSHAIGKPKEIKGEGLEHLESWLAVFLVWILPEARTEEEKQGDRKSRENPTETRLRAEQITAGPGGRLERGWPQN